MKGAVSCRPFLHVQIAVPASSSQRLRLGLGRPLPQARSQPPMKVGNLLSSKRFRCVGNQCALLRVNPLDPLPSSGTYHTATSQLLVWCIVERLLLYRSHLFNHLLGNSPIARVRAVGTLCLPREISSLEDPHATSRASVWNGIASSTCFL